MNYKSFKLIILILALTTPLSFAKNLSPLNHVDTKKNNSSGLTIKDAETAKKEYDNLPGIKVDIILKDRAGTNYFSLEKYSLHTYKLPNHNKLTVWEKLFENVHLNFKSTGDYLHFQYLYFWQAYGSSKFVDDSIEFKISDKAILKIDDNTIPVTEFLKINNHIQFNKITILDYETHFSPVENFYYGGVIETKNGNISIIENRYEDSSD